MEHKKHFLIIGGTGEIGSALVELLLKSNCKVSFTYNKNKTLSEELANKGAKAIPFDIKSPNSFNNLFSNVDQLDGIIYSIGVTPEQIIANDFKKISEIDESILAELDLFFVKGPYQLLNHAQNKMNPSGGNIILVNTLDGIKTQPGNVAFSQYRSSMKGLIESASRELGPKGIKINQVCIGLIKGKIQNKIPRHVQEKYLKHCALNRFANPLEVANVVGWVSMNNTYITGESLVLDGAL